MPDLTPDTLQDVFSQYMPTTLLPLLRYKGFDNDGNVVNKYYVNNWQPITSNGQVYQAAAFKMSLGSDESDNMPDVTLTFEPRRDMQSRLVDAGYTLGDDGLTIAKVELSMTYQVQCADRLWLTYEGMQWYNQSHPYFEISAAQATNIGGMSTGSNDSGTIQDIINCNNVIVPNNPFYKFLLLFLW